MTEKLGNNFGEILAGSGFKPDEEQHNPYMLINPTPNLSQNPIDPEDQRRVTNALGGETKIILDADQERLRDNLIAKIVGLRASASNASPALKARIEGLSSNVDPKELGSALGAVEALQQEVAAAADDDNDTSPEKPSLGRRFVNAVAKIFTGDRRDQNHQSAGNPEIFDNLRAQLGTMTPDIEIYKQGQLIGKERTIG